MSIYFFVFLPGMVVFTILREIKFTLEKFTPFPHKKALYIFVFAWVSLFYVAFSLSHFMSLSHDSKAHEA